MLCPRGPCRRLLQQRLREPHRRSPLLTAGGIQICWTSCWLSPIPSTLGKAIQAHQMRSRMPLGHLGHSLHSLHSLRLIHPCRQQRQRQSGQRLLTGLPCLRLPTWQLLQPLLQPGPGTVSAAPPKLPELPLAWWWQPPLLLPPVLAKQRQALCKQSRQVHSACSSRVLARASLHRQTPARGSLPGGMMMVLHPSLCAGDAQLP